MNYIYHLSCWPIGTYIHLASKSAKTKLLILFQEFTKRTYMRSQSGSIEIWSQIGIETFEGIFGYFGWWTWRIIWAQNCPRIQRICDSIRRLGKNSLQCTLNIYWCQKCWNILSRYINKSQSISPFFESWLSTESGLTTSVVIDLGSSGFFSGVFRGERNCQSGRPKFDTGGLLGNLELKKNQMRHFLWFSKIVWY